MIPGKKTLFPGHPLETAEDYYDVLTTVAFDHRASGSTVEFLGSGIFSNIEENSDGVVPTTFRLSQPHPNPFNSKTSLNFFLPDPGYLNISIYNVAGQLVEKFEPDHFYRGKHKYLIDLKNQSSGIYFINVQFRDKSIVRKLVLMR